MKKSYILLLLILAAVVNAQPEVKWTELSSSKGDFRILLPSDFIAVKTDDSVRIFAYAENISVRVEKREVGNPRDYIKKNAFSNTKEPYKNIEINLGDFFLKQADFYTEREHSFYV